MRPIVRERILNKYGRKCVKCGSKENLEIDHIIPLSIGGKHDEENFQPLCLKCNRSKNRMSGFNELFKKYINISESNKYVLISQDFPISALASPFFIDFIKFVLKEHSNFWDKVDE